ncbi:succinyl-CoA--L-malate CoA-transferase alpha subunit (plasmid) [Antarctobacter heliothermus]|uniref:Succinyl-CoA--L-malate CoA-transferase alpha subunit n=1 Tax=Antarctobacter heliothermus TaxID=74033 RepID=A0A222EBV0_9RHOB|nr:CoA transferase [Antarctobacter heliothermus]ASP23676.1 succinyl-CoA--L-malate CoA-transferase alpha subunit [Antarctobacter heliothermus]
MDVGADSSGTSGPLDGLRVIEIGHFVAAPFCARLLGDLGAEVIKIEPMTGDPVRTWGKARDGRSAWWSVHGRNKRSVTIDLKSAEGRELVLDLVAKSDALVENFRPGQLGRMGLNDDLMRARNPQLVIAHISGFGQDGPDSGRSGFGAIGEAIGGLRYLTNHAAGDTDLPPVRVGVSIGDSLAGIYAALGIVSALWARDSPGGTGQGQPVDVALTEAVLSIMEGVVPEYSVFQAVREPVGARIPTTAPSSAYPTRDGKWIIIAANSAPLFDRLCDVIGQPDLPLDNRFRDNPGRVANVDALDRIIEEWSVTQDCAEVEAALNARNIPNSPIYSAADIAADAQFRARGMLRSIDDPVLGAVLHPGVVPMMPESGAGIRWPGREIGEDTGFVLTGLLDRSAAQVADLKARGIV